ncbi:MAG: DNA methyltransferase [Dehalococcoidia bacterium]
MPRLQTNTLYYGDNLPILRDYIPDESIDLIYLDPPFNSNRSYNVLFKETAGPSPAQTGAFEDTWHWGNATIQAYEEVVTNGPDTTARLLSAMMSALGHNDVMAYLSMMAIRLLELRRVLKPTGSIYLHCDPTAGHYLKVLMDSVFGPKRFRNEVIWKRTHSHGGANRFGAVHDIILSYSKTSTFMWNAKRLRYSDQYVEGFFKFSDADGRRYRSTILTGSGTRTGSSGKPWRGVDPTNSGRHWAVPGYARRRIGDVDPSNVQAALDRLDEIGRVIWPAKAGGIPTFKQYIDDLGGAEIQDVWTDIPPISAQAKERLGYPTQKPLALLERIIAASSSEGDVVLDPFCGCGTAIHAAQNLNRKWIGIDITHLAIGLIRRRLLDAFPKLQGKIRVIGEPEDLPGAAELAKNDPYQFQWWALDRVDAQPLTDERKKGRDRGVDGIIPFLEGTDRRRAIVSVKSGKLTPAFVRDLKGTVEREKEPMGVLLTLNEPTREMKTEAAAAGTYRSETWQKSYPKIQIITVADIFNGRNVQMPPKVSPFAQAAREREREGEQATLI